MKYATNAKKIEIIVRRSNIVKPGLKNFEFGSIYYNWIGDTGNYRWMCEVNLKTCSN